MRYAEGDVDESIGGVVLAGGRSARMGADKAFVQLDGVRFIDIAIERARPQVHELAVSANEPLERFTGLGLRVIPDAAGAFAGPLAGIYSAMLWAQKALPHCRSLVSFAVDTPFFPRDLVARLRARRDDESAVLATAASGGRLEPIFTLWPVALAPELHAALHEPRIPRLADVVARYAPAVAVFASEPDAFLNINTPAELEAARRQARFHRPRRHIQEGREPNSP
jgi:molybdopterin-guanine dinucleotide biosynthesis protein A